MPADVYFATKPDIDLQQVRQTMEAGIKTGIVLADAAYGKGTAWREQLADWGRLTYCVSVHEDLNVGRLTPSRNHHAGRALDDHRPAGSRGRTIT